jgi:hypothetical protein
VVWGVYRLGDFEDRRRAVDENATAIAQFRSKFRLTAVRAFQRHTQPSSSIHKNCQGGNIFLGLFVPIFFDGSIEFFEAREVSLGKHQTMVMK